MLDFPVWKRWLIGLVVIVAYALALPTLLPQNFTDKLPALIAKLQIAFAVDLRGGSRIVVELDRSDNAQPQSSQNFSNATLHDESLKVMRQRLEAAGSAFANARISKQARGQIKIEVPALFDVGLLKNFVTIPAQLSIYQPYQGIDAEQIIIGHAELPQQATIFYDHDGDPPIGYLVDTKPLFTSQDIGQTFVVQESKDQAHIDIDIDQLMPPPSSTNLIAVMDGEMITTARINADDHLILDNLTPDFAKNLAHVINSGPLPVATRVLEERSIGADLGDEFARSGLKAALGALMIVALFMILCYGLLGIFAIITLATNLALLITILSLTGIPLSLAGFAGLVLTIGVSVDALILIYERIREEYRHGKPLKHFPKSGNRFLDKKCGKNNKLEHLGECPNKTNHVLENALAAGFLRARNTIIDANVTTLLGAIMLLLFGDGPLAGFALTVTIGLLASLFTSLIVAKWLIGLWLYHFKPTHLPARLWRLVPNATNIAFMRVRKIFLTLSLAITSLTIILLSSAGLHYGIDFAGGSVAILTPHQTQTNMVDIVRRANELNIGNVTAHWSENGDKIHLTIPSQAMGEEADQTVALKLRGEFDADYQLDRMDVVGPTIANQASQISLWAVFLALAAIFLYVWGRFNWKFGLSALITTLHDIVVLILIFALTQWEFNLWSIAALLAIIGYSLNDTIVVYDRIRSLKKHADKISMAQMIDLGINKTLSRTILTSLATLLAHIPLYYYGGTDMRNFASVLLLGILIGTASSILIAGPLLAIVDRLEHFPKSVTRFLDKKCGKNK